jgi:signal transduction histidine kinase/CheY-like chemotaxis protein
MPSRSLVVARAASAAVTVVALAVLCGWWLPTPGLSRLYLPGPSVKTNAALALACLGVSNLLRMAGASSLTRRAATALASLALAIGAATLFEHLVGWDLRLDTLLAVEAPGALATPSPNRMGPPVSLSIVLIGAALVALETRSAPRRALAHALSLLTCAIALLSLIGYAYGITELYSADYSGIPLIAAVLLLTLGVAVQAGAPETGLPALIMRGDEVGLFVRRLLLAAIVLPFGIGWGMVALVDMQAFGGSVAISAMALMLTLFLTWLIWTTGRRLARSSDARAAFEHALAASEQSLRETDRQRSEFLATLSHELRNPLAPIRFAVELLDGPPPVAERARQNIDRQVRHLTRLTDDLLDLTRISTNKLQLRPRTCPVGELVDDAVGAVASEVQQAGQTLSVEGSSEPLWLDADPDRVVQMLVNLLNNASRYTDRGGRIVLSVEASGADVKLSVRDTGRGIAAEDLPRVFERFVQVGESRQGGLGIGLALVKALAERQHGEVTAASAGVGQGATFTIRLPRAVAPAGGAETARPGRPEPRRRILVVDDNQDAADMLGTVIGAWGHDVLVCYDPLDAQSRAVVFGPDAALLDLGMPLMDGFELARRLRAGTAGRSLFLVAITGWGQDDVRARALEAGFDAHLTKPADPAALRELLASRFAAQAAASEADLPAG